MKKLLKRTLVNGNANVTEQGDEKIQAAGTIGEQVCSILSQQGIEYEMDDDLIVFEYHFERYFFQCDDGCYFYLCLCFSIGEDYDLMEWLVLANKVNATYRMAKMVVREDDFLLTAETPIEPGTNVEYLLRYSLRLLDDAQNFIRYNLPGRDNSNVAPTPIVPNDLPFSPSNEEEKVNDNSKPLIGFTSNLY